MMWRALRVLLLAAIIVPAARAADDALPADYEPLQRFPAGQVAVRAAGGLHEFRVWIARTPRHRAQGLMYVRTLDPDRGMLFVFPTPLIASFWMRNTYIPLDMLFVRANGRIANIAASTRPLSTDPYESVAPVVAVLEVAGGTAARLGIREGDRVHLPRGTLRSAR
jgi:uncharacterized membrane protein (UPF0127 family)